MARPAVEWIGATDGTRAPPRVRQRVFDREGGKCHLCGQIIQAPGQKWDLDHVAALINGGENRETNLKPTHRKCHKDKTAADVAEKAKVAAIRGKHIGATRPSSKLATGEKRSPKRLTKELPTRVRDIFGRPLIQQKEASDAWE